MTQAKSDAQNVRDKRQEEIREKIQASIDRAKKEHQREMFIKRLDLVRTGFNALQARKFNEAVRNFRTYILITENWKEVKPGGLHPNLFTDLGDDREIFLLNGVYWELSKIYDHSDSKQGLTDMIHFLQQYVKFTKGQPFEPVSSETLRKYIRNNKVKHTSEFKAAYKQLGGEGCFIVTAVLPFHSVETLGIFRQFRDEVLNKNRFGRFLIFLYYKMSPPLARKLYFKSDKFKSKTAFVLKKISEILTHFLP